MAWWLKGQATQNFGDFLTLLLCERLLDCSDLQDNKRYRLIGSCIADFIIEDHLQERLPVAEIVFWGCGCRTYTQFSSKYRDKVKICGVRGELSRQALGLPHDTPVGDPALLLPLFHPAPASNSKGALLVPHFSDDRSDEELLALTGCDAVLRPALQNDVSQLLTFIDQLLAAEIALCGALHAAIVRAAYRRPFAFWQSGRVDLPFKWYDFAASVGIPGRFPRNAEAAWAVWNKDIHPNLSLPSLRRLLDVAPMPVREKNLVWPD